MAFSVARTSGSNALRSISRSASAPASQRRLFSNTRRICAEVEKAPSAGPSSSSKSSSNNNASPKLTTIVDQIEKLTLLEAAELVAQLKERLNIQDIAMPAAGAAPVAAAPAAEAAPAEEEKPKEKSLFTVKLKGLKDASAKAKVIKEIKALNSNMNLVEAKKFVESAPQTLKEGLTKEEAEKLQKAIEAAGGLTETE